MENSFLNKDIFGLDNGVHHTQDIQVLKQPEHELVFFSLNTPLMNILFKEIQSGQVSYRSFKMWGNTDVNCSDLTFLLLKEGGIEEYTNLISKIRMLPARVTFFTPNVIGNILYQAKQAELQRFPETKDMKIPDEYKAQEKKLSP